MTGRTHTMPLRRQSTGATYQPGRPTAATLYLAQRIVSHTSRTAVIAGRETKNPKRKETTMATVEFKSKEHLGSGNYEWTYTCTCSDSKEHEVKVTTGNQSQAEALALMECEEKCGEGIS